MKSRRLLFACYVSAVACATMHQLPNRAEKTLVGRLDLLSQLGARVSLPTGNGFLGSLVGPNRWTVNAVEI